MTPEQFALMKEVLLAAQELPADQQQAYVHKACGDDQALIKAVLSMLQVKESTWAQAIEQPAIVRHLNESKRQEELPELAVGDQIHTYTIVKKIGTGGMGHVYAAQQQYPAERQVALKLIKKSPNQKYLINEIQILASLNHPNIATLYEINQTEQGQTYIAMELVEGLDMISWCQQRQCSQAQRIRLFLQLCQGIAYAHEKGIIHCDIKPSNVLVTEVSGAPVVKVIDFGVSQFQDQLAEDNSISGTPSYMAPEVMQSQAKPLADTRRDIYAMGVLLRKFLDDVPLNQDFQAIIDRATAAQPDARYGAVLSLRDDIHRFFDRRPISARPHTWTYLSGLFIKRRLGVVLFSLALLATVVAGYWAQRQQAQLATEQAQKAQLAQAEAEEMATFLTDLFNVANPEKGRESAVTAQQLLHNAKDQLLAVEQPTLSDARFMHTIGSILTRMDQFADAEALIQQSLAVKQRLLPANHEEIISGLSQLGLIHRKTLDYVQAENTLLATIELAQTQEPVNLDQLAYAHNHLGNVYNQTRQPAKAIEQHLAAIALRQQLGDRKHLADSYNNLGVAYRQQKDWSATAKHMNQALDIYLEVYDADHPFIAAIKHNLAYVEEQGFNWDVADQMLKQAITTWREAYGPIHSNTLIGITNQVLYFQRRLRFAETVPILLDVIDHLAAEGAVEKQADFLSHLGRSQAHLGQVEPAHEAHIRSLQLIEGLALQDTQLPAKLHYRFAESLLELAEYEAAADQVKHSQQALSKLPSEHNLHLYLNNLLAKVKSRQGDGAAAKALFQSVLAHNKPDNTRNQTEQVTALLGLGRVHRTLFELEEATEVLLRALALNVQVNGDAHKTNGLIHAELGLVFHDLEQPERAENHLKMALRIQQRALPAKHPDLLATEHSMTQLGLAMAE
ncbi:serine/threonine-protein kinase [Marinicella meishanensis]|uniref:serine/threonine-protein kinase n=1 Tax=Marinicella meishanensis TaxID=2873263 RepID=UPI001CBE872E|nr:serine/threonine-protein kinase [Marinicella sp. NBU2979]